MNKEVPTVDERATVLEAAKLMVKLTRGFLVVLKEGQPKGIITERDLVKKVIAEGKDPQKVIVLEVMSSPLVTVDPDEDLLKASKLMQDNQIRRLPVVKDGIIYGVLSSTDIARKVGEYVDRSVRDIMRWASPIGI